MSNPLSGKEAGYAKNMNFFADKLKLFFALFFISFFSLEGFAQTVYTWTGSAGGTSWNDSGNWADGNVADISGSSEVKIVLENNVEISDDLTFNSSGSNQITIDTNGYNFECNRIILVDMVYNKASASVIFSGSGTLSTEIFDFPNTGTHSLTVESGTTFKITSKFFGNVYNSSDKFEFKGNGTLYIPASGADLTYGQCGVFYDSTLTVLPIGTPTYFSISSDGKSIHPADSAEGLGITCSVTRNGGTGNVSFSYTAEALGGVSLSDFLFKGAELTGSGEVIVQGSSNTETVHLKYNGSGLSAGAGVKLSFKTPDKSMIIAEIVWVEQSPVWTGNVSSDWGDSRNWSNGTVPGNNSEVVISSGCTNYPKITAAAFAKSVAIKSNASIVITSGGSLKVESIICTGNSSMDISGGILKISSLIETKDFGCINSSGSSGTVEISGNCTFKAINPQRCEFFNIVTDSDSTFSIENDIYVLGNWTNRGNFYAQGHTVFFTGNSSDSSVTAGLSHFSGFVVKNGIYVNDSVVIDGDAVFYDEIRSFSSGNVVFNGNVDCKSGVTLGCSFSFGPGSSFSAPNGDLYLKGNADFSGCGSFLHNDGTIYFHGFDPETEKTLTTKNSQEFWNLNVSGSVKLELNGTVEARKFSLKNENPSFGGSYTTELTGSGSLVSQEEILLTNSGASDSVTLLLDADLTSSKEVKSENGVIVEIKSGKTFKAASFVHETSQSTPFSEIRVYGTLDVKDEGSAADGTVLLSEKNGRSGGMKLSVFSGGNVQSKKIIAQANYSNGSDSVVISNAGTIEVSEEILINSDTSGSGILFFELMEGFQLSGSGILKINSSILKYSGTSDASSVFDVELSGSTGNPVKVVSDSAKITFENVSYIDEPELSVQGKVALTASSGGTVSRLTAETEETVFYLAGSFTVSGEASLFGKVEASDELYFRGNIVSKSGVASVKASTVYAGEPSASPLDSVTVSGDMSGSVLKIDCDFVNNADFVIAGSVNFAVSGDFSGNGKFTASPFEMKFGGNVDFSSTDFNANGGVLRFAGSDGLPKTFTAKADGSTLLCSLSISDGSKVETTSSFSVSGNWNNENLDGGFCASAGTVTFNGTAASVSINGNNEFYVLKFENPGTTVKTVGFEAGKIQKIAEKIISSGNENGRIKLTTSDASPSYSDSSTWWKIDWPSDKAAALSPSEFKYTDIEYSESVNDIAHDWGISVAESVEASTEKWFFRHFYWYGRADEKWTNPANWSTDSLSYVASSFYPPYLRGSSEITIAENDVNILVLDDAEYTVKNFTVSAGASVDFNGKKISIAGNEASDCFTNAGTVRLSGEESIVMPLDDWSKVVQADGSYIEYYGALGETLPWKTSCKNLRFADGAASSVSGTGIVSAVSVDGDTLIENGRDNELILSGANVFSGGVQIRSAGRLTLNAAENENLEIKADAECTSLTVVSPVVLNGKVSTLENQVYEKDVTSSSGFVLDAGSGHIKFGRDSVSVSVKISSLSDQVYKSPIKASAGLIFDAGSSKVKFENSGGLSPFVESAGNQIYKSTVWISSPASDSFSFTRASSAVDIQFCKGLETQASENTAVLLDVSPDGNVYFSGAGTVGGAASKINCTGTVYFACSSNSQELKLSSPAKALNVVHLGGNLVLAAHADTVEAEKDLVLLSGISSVIFSDVDSDRTDLFRYLRADSDLDAPDTASSSLNDLPSSWPDNSAGFPDGSDTNPFCASITGLGGKTLKAGKNFYANSVDLLGSDFWHLVIPPTENASDCFAEMYNLAVSHCRATSAVAACENCTDSGENSNIDFVRPELNVAYTVFDDVIYLEFSEPVENSNNEISKAVNKAFFYFNGSADESFAGSFTDADCAISTDGQGDLQTFYVKAGNKWNTDATGSSAGDSQSSDRSGVHRSAIPYVKMLKASPTFFASLRDEHKNRLASKDFTDVADGAAPVLIAVSTGQELHSPYSQPVGEESQPPYDAHNFIELQYSEEVFVPGVAKDSVNIQSSASLGNVSGISGLTVAGIARFSSGSISCGTNDGSDVESIHALYRNFATTRSDAMNYDSSYSNPQTHRLRISVAGFSGGTVVPQDSNTYRSWFGYIDSISSPESATVACISNPLITDNAAQPNAIDAVGTALHPLPVLYVNQRAFEHDSVLYGAWDTNPPSFACFRGKTEWTAMASSNECEVLGIGDEGATFINRMEFHLFDNKPSFSASDLAAWRSRVGWVSSFGEEGSVLTAARSYAADIFGGAKPFAFASDSDRATGGIRYSSLYNQASGFKYSAEDSDSFQSFASSEISPKVTINIFNDLNANRRVSTLGADGLYFSISMPPASRYSLRQTFTICYDDSAAFVTDLAGNRLRSATIKTIDITPPSFNFTLAPLGQNKLYILFSKKIAFTDSVLENISKNLELVEGNSLSAGLKIDENVPAKLCFSGNTATGFLLELNRNVTLDDVKKLYISVKNTGTGIDPITGLSANVSCIQDELGNYALVHSAHALSDFAVNAVQVNYAYDNRLIDEDGQPLPYSVSDGNWAARDFSAGQKNSGTLLSGHDISINANIYDGTQDNSGGFADSGVPVLFADNSPDAEALSTEINLNAQKNLRIWLPGLTSDVFKSFATANNSEFTEFVSGVLNGNSATFTLPVTREAQYNSWGGGNQISFIFALTDSSNEIVKIRHVPFYENENSYSEPGGVEYPLFAVRQVSSDISDIDLWSFRLKDEKLQRGGVSILNNVINANQGEKTTVQVDMAQDGNLNVVVVTLDGNIVTYLQHGRVSSGTHYYRWDGKNNSGNKVARGLYFIRVTGSGIDETRKVMVVKE